MEIWHRIFRCVSAVPLTPSHTHTHVFLNYLHFCARSLGGGKHTLYEGGVRATAFVWGPGFLGIGVNRTWQGFAHIVDVGPTLLEAAGVAPVPPLPGKPVHGTSFWSQLLAGTPSAREEVILNCDYTSPSQAAIVTPDG